MIHAHKLILFISATAVATLARAQFNPGPNPIVAGVGPQILAGGAGTVEAGGSITVASGGGVALSLSGVSTLTNQGTIQTLGTGRAIDSNSGVANLSVTNSGLISSERGDAFRINTNSAVDLFNSGTIRVQDGGQAIDWAAISSQSNTLTNLATGLISAVGEDAIRPGNGGVIVNAGAIVATPTGTTSPSGSDGIDLRTEKTVTVTNTGAIQGRHGIATDGDNAGPSSLTVNNNAGTIAAVNGSGINVDGVSTDVVANVTNAFGATIQGGVLASSAAGDGDGVDVDGILTLTNSGEILGLGAKGAGNNAEAVSIGGGSIVNTATGQIIGSSLLVDAPNGDVTKAGNGILVDNSDGGDAIAATSITNAGLIQGTAGFGIKIVGAFDDVITNENSGTIQGGKTAVEASYAAVVNTGAGNDVVTNRGSIASDGGFAGNGVMLGAGDDALHLLGANARVTGSLDGGFGGETAGDRLTVDLGGPGEAFVGALSNFEQVELQSSVLRVFGDVSLLGSLDLYTDGSSIAFSRLVFDASTTGTLHLGLSSLLSVNFGATLLPGEELILIDIENTASSIQGTFAGLDEGAQLTIGAAHYIVSYVGGTGNDLSIRRIASTPDAARTILLFGGALAALAAFRRGFGRRERKTVDCLG